MWQKQSQGIIIVLNIFLKVNICKLSFFHLIIWVRFPYVHLTVQIFILNNLFVCLFSCGFNNFFHFFIDFDGYYIIRTDEGQPRPKYICNKCGTNINFFLLYELYRGLVHHHHRILNGIYIYKPPLPSPPGQIPVYAPG